MAYKRELCVHCAIKIGETMVVKLVANRREKITCAQCGRRRFGNEYEISKKTAKAAK